MLTSNQVRAAALKEIVELTKTPAAEIHAREGGVFGLLGKIQAIGDMALRTPNTLSSRYEDNEVECCICFRMVKISELAREDGRLIDVCQKCKDWEEMREEQNGTV